MTTGVICCKTTGIGSLPFLEKQRALDWAFAVDIPYFPTLPQRDPKEGMVPQGIAGFPGAVLESSGGVSWSPGAWESGRDELAERLLEDFNRNRYIDFLPPAESSCWEVFMQRLNRMEGVVAAKSQLVGPVTLARLLQEWEGEVFDQLAEFLFAKALAMGTAIRLAGKQAIFFWDEPGLQDVDFSEEPACLALAKLRDLVVDLKNHGILVGLHCCGRADFRALFNWPLDYLSFDSALSLGAILQDTAGLSNWLKSGGKLSFGAVPTRLPADWNVRRISREITDRLTPFQAVLKDNLLTPACGLGLRTEEETKAVFTALEDVKRNLANL